LAKATNARCDQFERWPDERSRFQRVFDTLIEVPERRASLFEDLTNNTPPPSIREWDPENYQESFLYQLMMDIGLDV
jgi:hypothetical protein